MLFYFPTNLFFPVFLIPCLNPNLLIHLLTFSFPKELKKKPHFYCSAGLLAMNSFTKNTPRLGGVVVVKRSNRCIL